MTYKGYTGEAQWDEDASLFHGNVLYLRDVVTFQGRTTEEINQAFRDSVDDYLQWCEELGQAPEKPFSGHLRLEMAPEQQQHLAQIAAKEGKTLDEWAKDVLLSAAK